ncbi:MAG: chemoreceptor glutamine deamidase CheD [Colwellia sp.]
MLRANNPKVKECIEQCLPEFRHINHYWDKDRQIVVAKILPGEFYTTTNKVAIATTLGSCISACIWDEKTHIGGMNHFMLPATEKEVHEVNWGQRNNLSDATRYGNFAMEHLINTILKNGGRKANLKVKIFGGGKVLRKMSDVGERNIEFVLKYLEQEEMDIDTADVGDIYPRKVFFDPSTGKVFVKKLTNLHNETIIKREADYSHQIVDDDVDGDVELF